MASSSSQLVLASTSPSSFSCKYDVFLSFRGKDTRAGITDHLHKELLRQGFRAFRDDPELERGTCISPELLAAIEQSRCAIVVVSPNYATSTWCLLELCKIFECMKERGTILPIFYKVNPSDVRSQKGSFAIAFDDHIKNGEDGKLIQEWREALSKVASLAGWTSDTYGYETDLIRDVLHALLKKVYPIVDSSENLVGMELKLKEMNVLLDREANDVRFIGLWGMGGIGKTTLARRVYERISYEFEVCIFVPDVRENYAKHGRVHLQKQIIGQILKEENVLVWDHNSAITKTKRCLNKKAVLLVFDNVDEVKQIEMLVGEKDWLGLKSRIIITTKNRRVLDELGIENQYKVEGLNDVDALELFCWKAFRKDKPKDGYAELSKCFVSYAKGLPLALKVLGAFLYKRSLDAWISALAKLKNTPNKEIFDVLKVSYDGLDEMEKKFFLDIACFSSQCEAKFIVKLLYSYDSCTHITKDVLVERCLLTSSWDNEIGIHDLIREMGCDIVRKESSDDEPGERSRLWHREDIIHVFTQNTGTDAVKDIFLHLPELEEANWNCEAFSKMCKLKRLYIHNLKLSHGPSYISSALTLLHWSWYPSKFLPPSFQPYQLTELSLVHSSVHHLWEGSKNSPNLKSIDLSYSTKLTKTPDFTGTVNLEKLVFEGCINLYEVHESIGKLKRLKIFNFRNCKSIKSLPSEVELESLETFDVSGCSKLQVLPEFSRQMNRLLKLSLSGTCVKRLPASYANLSKSLVELDLCGIFIREPQFSPFMKQCLKFLSFGLFPSASLQHPLSPMLSSLKHLTCLTTLKLKHCNLYEGEIPDDIGSLSSLETLDLRGNNFLTLPAGIGLLSKLKELVLENCERLQQLPMLPSTAELEIRMDNCTSLQVLPDLPASCSLSEFQLSCINCLSTLGDQDCTSFINSLRKRLIEEPPRSFDYLSFVIPGGEIGDWFSSPSVGDSVTLQLPPYASNTNKWIGVVVCAQLVPQDNPYTVSENDYLESGKNQILCTWNGSTILTGFGSVLTQIVSDHIFIAVLPSRLWGHRNTLEDTYNVVKFSFEATRAVGNKRSVTVKQCAALVLCGNEVEEPISNVSQSDSRIFAYTEDNVDSTYEQDGVVTGTAEAGWSTSDDEDEYCYCFDE